jgi:hypothetical protein
MEVVEICVSFVACAAGSFFVLNDFISDVYNMFVMVVQLFDYRKNAKE